LLASADGDQRTIPDLSEPNPLHNLSTTLTPLQSLQPLTTRQESHSTLILFALEIADDRLGVGPREGH
jgi:hypothetical protein